MALKQSITVICFVLNCESATCIKEICLMDKFLEQILDQHCPIKFSVMEMLYIWAVQCGSCYLHVATEHFKCGNCA